jgi:8-oxo-dGTP diphosphatase
MAMEENPTVYPSYEAPTLTVDAVIFQLIGDRLHVLLIKRRRDPFAGAGALPGVYNPKGETTLQALSRALHAKAGIEGENLGLIRQLQVSDTVARDPRGHAVSVVYLGLGRNLQPTTAPNVADPGFFPVDDLPELAFDHAEIIADAIMYLKTQIMDVNILAALLAEKFTLTQLQSELPQENSCAAAY